MAEQTLANHSDRLNAINIYPVADADTGTNLYLTIRAASQAVAESEPADVGATLAIAGRGAMEQARGNSGTLIAVSISAMAEPLLGAQRMSGPLLAAALHRAQLRAWSALSEPMPGTILSVLEAAAKGATSAESALNGDESNQALAETINGAVWAARAAVELTESQLDPLTRAGVVDAGGVGLLLILDCLRAVILGEFLQEDLLDGLSGYKVQDPNIALEMPEQEGVEVMCTISLTPLAAAGLRLELDGLGDSVIMSAVTEEADPTGAYPWRLHVHVPSAAVALDAIHAVGDPSNVSISALTASVSEDLHDVL
ncbi:dihydroxyacetone kinase-like predicted kinase [Arthrobacter stackebrandtii]|uniref:Dihydroxyacetone kinase-like predicted kinase n=1 Tax=Arthrobacter stackebrandtii TaxID=272161 RepID=A0ABS4YZ60_9MICC|nr:DAK2 domain-containing protein [Arthrobacter stackebrandtii]MBP2414082.1 dihydroxyacetone kinase-like predicted kinase [Arthrobacter stackebrandtii]PYG99373.1 Dak phosphatase [Arthrobacter stackebrandtii]